MFEEFRISTTSSASRHPHSFKEFLLAIHTLKLCEQDNSCLFVFHRIIFHIFQFLDSLLIEIIDFNLIFVSLLWVIFNQSFIFLFFLQLLSHSHHILQSSIIIQSKIDIHDRVLVFIHNFCLRVNSLFSLKIQNRFNIPPYFSL